jgi:hypothetical protein
LWTGLHTPNGAGILPVRENGCVQQRTAAQVAWELHVGPVPPGRRVWRRCRRPACVRPDHLLLVRRGYPPLAGDAGTGAPTEPSTHIASRGQTRRGQGDGRRVWWTRERVLTGLLAFHATTGLTPTTSLVWPGLIRSTSAPGQPPRHYPSAYAVLRHFPNFRAAWAAAGIQLDDAHWAPWTPADDRYLVAHLGIQPTAAIAASLGRGEAAVRTRARDLGLHVGDAWGWPILRVARMTGVSEFVLRGYIERGELAVFKGAKHVYVDAGDLTVVDEIDWDHVPDELEAAALRSLRSRLLLLLAGQDWRSARPHRPCQPPPQPGRAQRRTVPRPPLPPWARPGTLVRVAGPTPMAPQCEGRLGHIQQPFWSVHFRQPAPQWRVVVVFSKQRP